MVEASKPSDNHQILQNARRSLDQNPADPTGTLRRTILVGLIKTKAFDEAVQFIKQQKDQDYSFEHAYILHRLGQNTQALVQLERVKNQASVCYLHLKAQVLYKLGQYSQAVECYEEVVGKGLNDDGMEIATNLLACSAN